MNTIDKKYRWDINKSWSFQCLFNFIIGARGVGKTYACKKKVIQNYLKKGEEFLYLRRYNEEFNQIERFFNDVAIEFPDHEFKAEGGTFYCDKEVIGYYWSLSRAKIFKSVPYPKVSMIIFDEFILDKGVYHYIPDEVTNFLEAYSTVARERDVIVYFLGNAITMANPYFFYFKLYLPYNKSGISVNDDKLIEVVHNPGYAEAMKKTRFGRLVSGTPYGNYAIDNEFLRDNKDFIRKKNQLAKFAFSMRYKGKVIGVWIDYSNGKYYISFDTDKTKPFCYAITTDDHTPNTMLLKANKANPLKQLAKNYGLGNVYFENLELKNAVQDILAMMI